MLGPGIAQRYFCSVLREEPAIERAHATSAHHTQMLDTSVPCMLPNMRCSRRNPRRIGEDPRFGPAVVV
jgi:hypothetical protein